MSYSHTLLQQFGMKNPSSMIPNPNWTGMKLEFGQTPKTRGDSGRVVGVNGGNSNTKRTRMGRDSDLLRWKDVKHQAQMWWDRTGVSRMTQNIGQRRL